MATEQLSKMGRNAPVWRRALFRFFAHRYLKRRVKTRDVSFDVFVSAGAQLSALSPRGVPIDPVHTRFIARWVQPSSVIWDIGGNLGLFAFPAALKAAQGQVYTFEPDVDLASNLLRSLRQKGTVGLPPLALSDVDDVAEFLIAAHGKSMNKLAGAGPWHDNIFSVAEKRTVVTMRIDSVVKRLRPPDIIKIDVEGAEMRVLAGGKETIASARPIMLIEAPKH